MFRKTQKIILLLDTSGSMNGSPINDIKKAVNTLSQNLTKYNSSKTKVSVSIITC